MFQSHPYSVAYLFDGGIVRAEIEGEQVSVGSQKLTVVIELSGCQLLAQFTSTTVRWSLGTGDDERSGGEHESVDVCRHKR